MTLHEIANLFDLWSCTDTSGLTVDYSEPFADEIAMVDELFECPCHWAVLLASATDYSDLITLASLYLENNEPQ